MVGRHWLLTSLRQTFVPDDGSDPVVLLDETGGRSVRMFIDGELGANVALTNDNMSGVALRPGGLVGLRFGYDVYSGEDDSPSRTFEAEVLVRAITVDGGTGAMMGLGLLWGN